jgi:hypothetical protein
VQTEKLNQLERSITGEDAIDGDPLPFGEPLAERLESA